MDWPPLQQVLSIQAIGWTLVHSVWLGTAAWILHALLQVTLRRWDSRVRYAAACACLLLLVASLFLAWALASVIPVSAQPALWTTDAAAAPTTFDLSGLIKKSPAPEVKSWSRWLTRLNPYLPWVVLVWAMGIAAYLLSTVGAVALLHRRAARALTIDCRETLASFSRLCDRLLPGRPVMLRQTGFVSVPATFGWLRPVVLLPIGVLGNMPVHEIECILAHELAHIRRRDYLINLLQSFVETALFFHPLVRRISRQIRELREECCDDLAIEALEGRRKDYATAVLAFEKLRSSPAFALALSGGSVVGRLQRLVEGQRRVARRGYGHLLGALVVSCLCGSVAMGYVRGRIEEQETLAYAETHTVGQSLYRYLGVDHDNPDLVEAVSVAYQRTRRKRKLTPAEMDELSYVLVRGGRANALLQASASHFGAASKDKPLPGSTWDGGSQRDWYEFANELLKESRRAESAEQRQRLSRSAMLLAAQDSFGGFSFLTAIVRVPDFEELSGYPPATLARIRQIVSLAEQRNWSAMKPFRAWQQKPDGPLPAEVVLHAATNPELGFYLHEFLGIYGSQHPRYAEVKAVVDRLPFQLGVDSRPVPPWYFLDGSKVIRSKSQKPLTDSPHLKKYNDLELPATRLEFPPEALTSSPTTRPTTQPK